MDGRNVSTLGSRIHGPLLALTAIIVGISMGYGIVVQTFSSMGLVLAFCLSAWLIAFLVRPDFIVPAMIVTIPLEISKMYFPFLLVENTADEDPLSVIMLWRISLAIGAMAFFLLLLAQKDRKRTPIFRHAIVLSSVLFFVFCAVQAAMISPDRSRALIESVRLGAHILLLIITMGLLNSMRRIELALKAFLYSGLVLALLGIYQYFTGDFFWNVALKDPSGIDRINVTFRDPNIFARYLASLVLVSWVLISGSLMRKWLFKLCLIAGVLALLFTFSRSGWLLLPVGFVVIWWYTKGGTRLKVMAWGLAVGTLAFVLFSSVGVLQSRGLSLSAGIDALGARVDLINTGFQMYRDHPAFGVGLGSWGKVATEEYTDYLPYHAHGRTAYLSHTSLVTIMAELGTVGLALTFLIFGAIYRSFRKIQMSGLEPHKSYALAVFVAIISIVLSGQSEGDMFEQPMVWLFMGILIAIERVSHDESLLAGRRSQQALPKVDTFSG